MNYRVNPPAWTANIEDVNRQRIYHAPEYLTPWIFMSISLKTENLRKRITLAALCAIFAGHALGCVSYANWNGLAFGIILTQTNFATGTAIPASITNAFPAWIPPAN